MSENTPPQWADISSAPKPEADELARALMIAWSALAFVRSSPSETVAIGQTVAKAIKAIEPILTAYRKQGK